MKLKTAALLFAMLSIGGMSASGLTLAPAASAANLDEDGLGILLKDLDIALDEDIPLDEDGLGILLKDLDITEEEEE